MTPPYLRGNSRRYRNLKKRRNTVEILGGDIPEKAEAYNHNYTINNNALEKNSQD